jgi:hypothetical protein
MARSLKEIAQQVNKIKESRWSFEDEIDEFSNINIENLCFNGELDGKDLYMVCPVAFTNPNSGEIKKMTSNEIHDFFDTGDVDSKEDWSIDVWLVMRFDLSRNYIRIYKTSRVDLTKSPRDQYEAEYSRIKEFIDFEKPIGLLPQIYEIKLEDFSSPDPWLDLKDSVEFQANNEKYNVDIPVDMKKSKFFHAINRRILDDQFEKSGPDERIKVTENFTKMKVKRSTIDVFEGTMMESLFWPDKISLSSKKEAIDYLLSVLSWVKDHMNFDFSHIVKINESNRWAYQTEDETWISPEGVKVNPASYKKYEFRCCNLRGTPIMELEVWEDGHVFTYKNHDGGTPILYTREVENADKA